MLRNRHNPNKAGYPPMQAPAPSPSVLDPKDNRKRPNFTVECLTCMLASNGRSNERRRLRNLALKELNKERK